MKNSAVSRTEGFTRCAVCKIDLKGRFVYIDDEFENLLGYTREELFGKPVLSFLDEPSQDLVTRLLAERNHYETFFDTTTLTVLGHDGGAIRTRAVVSLSFIAGNPANFQFVLDRGGSIERVQVVSAEMSMTEFVDNLLAQSDLSDLKTCLDLTLRFTGAAQAGVYVIHEDHLEPRSACGDNGDAEYAFASLPELTDLHRRIATDGGVYSASDEASTLVAIEKEGSAPNEFVTRVQCFPRTQHLLRLIFREDCPPAELAEGASRARLAVGLLQRLASAESPAEPGSDTSVDIRFTIGFLDNIGIGAVLLQADGQIVGYNPSAARMFDTENLGDSYRDLLAVVDESNPGSVSIAIGDYLAPPNSQIPEQDLEVQLALPGDRSCLLTVVRLSDQADDMSACLVLRETPAVAGEAAAAGREQIPWQHIVEGLRSSSELIYERASQLGHEHYRRLGDNGNACLKDLMEGVRALNGKLDDVAALYRLAGESEEPSVVDLGLLADEIMAELQRTHPDAILAPPTVHLPKLKTHRNKLAAILRSLLSNAAKFGGGEPIKLNVQAEEDAATCRIVIEDGGLGIPERYRQRIFDLFFRTPGQATEAPPGSGLGLGIVNCLVRELGGSIDAASTEDKGTRMTVQIPLDQS